MSGTHILAFDPGTKTGAALLNVEDGVISQSEFAVLSNDELGQLLEYPPRCSHLVIERFVISAGTGKKGHQGDLADALVNTGKILQAFHHRKVVIHYQRPAEAKSFVDNGRLRREGLWDSIRAVEGRTEDHAQDAARHALLYAYAYCGVVPK